MSVDGIFSLSTIETFQVLEAARWPAEKRCPYCKSPKVWAHYDSTRRPRRWQCGSCQRAFCSTVGTIFHGTHIPLRTWFLAIAYLCTEAQTNSADFGNDVGISRRATIAKMFKKIRKAVILGGEDRDIIARILEKFEINYKNFAYIERI